MQASTLQQEQTNPLPVQMQSPVSPSNNVDHRFGEKIKIAFLITVSFVVLSSKPFYTLLNSIVCAFSITATPCVNENSPTMKGIIIAACILFIIALYFLRDI